MNNHEATQLAEKITRTWRGTIGTEIWYEVLEDIHYGPAEAAWRHLRDTLEHQPSIATYRSAYNAQLGTAREERTECGTCGGDGWETVIVGPTEFHTVLQPCRCANGNKVRDVHRRIVTHNDNELARLGHTPVHDATRRPDWITGHPLFGDNE